MNPLKKYVNSRLQAENEVKRIEARGGIAWIEALGLNGTFVPGNGTLYGLSVRYFNPSIVKKPHKKGDNNMFYTFYQNNSGGSFRPPAHYVIIEADSVSHANYIAESHGVYFDGCANGIDCSCCGDRWYPVSVHDGYDEPSIYGVPVDDFKPYFQDKRCSFALIVFANSVIRTVK